MPNEEDMSADLPLDQGRTLDAADWPGFRNQAHRMLDDMLDYVENIRERPVWQPIPDDVRSRFRSDLPEAPNDLAAVHQEFMRYVVPFQTIVVAPEFYDPKVPLPPHQVVFNAIGDADLCAPRWWRRNRSWLLARRR